jgi:transcriptional regulator with XRE-family HTH domain
MSVPDEPLPHQDAAKSVLAKNLVIARNAFGMTQGELSKKAGISRATIAQMEAGNTDPRLSTLVDLAAALGIRPIVLLLGEDEFSALMNVVKYPLRELSLERELPSLRQLLASGLSRQLLQATFIGADAARLAGLSVAGAAIGTALAPGIGTALIGAFGMLVNKRIKRQTGVSGDKSDDS